jgi:5,5'-dehydrodivanillate O-demethylase
MAATNGKNTNGKSTNGRARRTTRANWDDFVHTGPGTLTGRWMRQFWHPIYRAEDLPAGRAKPLRILGEDFTLYRAQSGTPYGLAFRCAHRGTQLSSGWVEGEDLRCYFHGWKYNSSGQCIEQPGEPESFCEKVRLKTYPVQEYLGVIWAYQGEGEPPPLPRFPEFEDESVGVREVFSYTWPCNFFNVIDNDPIHIPFVHRSFAANSNRMNVPLLESEETDYGFLTRANFGPGDTKLYHMYTPNLGHRKVDVGTAYTGDDLICRVPIDDGNCVTIFIHITHVTGEAREQFLERKRAAQQAEKPRFTAEELGAAVLRGELTIEEAAEKLQSSNFLDIGSLFNLQDYVAQVGQGTIVDLAEQRLGREDAPAIVLRKIWSRELRALAEGRPLKQWRRPEQMPVS